jgi:hypothetical protein
MRYTDAYQALKYHQEAVNQDVLETDHKKSIIYPKKSEILQESLPLERFTP